MKYKVNPQVKGEVGLKVGLISSCRLGLTALLTSGIAVMALLRLSLTISLVCMVKKPSALNQTYPVPPDGTEQTETTSALGRSPSTSGLTDDLQTTDAYVTPGSQTGQFEGEFDWTRQQIGVLLSAYFYGFCMTQLFGGYLAGRFGGKHVFGIATLISTVATLLCPVAARFNVYLFVALRTLLGLASGVMVPTMSTLLGLWIPPMERSFIMSVVGTGFTLGVVIASLISSQFCIIPIDNGWPLTFYVTGAGSFVFWVLWNLFAFSSPYDHPRISEAELNYIVASNKLQSSGQTKRKPFPILKALSSPAVLAIIAATVSNTWFGHTQSTTLPFYLRDVLRFDIKQNGLFTLLPYVLSVLVSPPMGYMVDILRSKQIISTATTRKILQGISNFGCALILLGVSFSDYNIRYMAVAFLMINMSVSNTARIGSLVNIQDIAPRYAGEILGISNTAGAFTGVIAPIIVGFITTTGSTDEWRKVFYIAISILTAGGIAFVIFAKGEVLPWAKDAEIVLPMITIPGDDDKKSIVPDKAPVLVPDHQDGQYDNNGFQLAEDGVIKTNWTDTATDKRDKTLDLDIRL